MFIHSEMPSFERMMVQSCFSCVSYFDKNICAFLVLFWIQFNTPSEMLTVSKYAEYLILSFFKGISFDECPMTNISIWITLHIFAAILDILPLCIFLSVIIHSFLHYAFHTYFKWTSVYSSSSSSSFFLDQCKDS